MIWRPALFFLLILNAPSVFAADTCRTASSNDIASLTQFVDQGTHTVRHIKRPAFCENPAFEFKGIESCTKYKKEYLQYFAQCLDTYRMSDPQSTESLLVRRKQLEQAFDLEIMLLSRASMLGKPFEDKWAAFETKWRSRLNSGEVQYIDTLPALKPDQRGQLRMRLEHLAELKPMLITMGQGLSQDTGLTRRPGIDLIKAAVFLEATKKLEKQKHDMSGHSTATPQPEQSRHAAHGKTPSYPKEYPITQQRDMVYAYFPELEMDSGLLKNTLGISLTKEALKIAKRSLDLPSVYRELAGPNRSNTLQDKMTFLNEKVGKEIERKLKTDKVTKIYVAALESQFLGAMEKLQTEIDQSLTSAANQNWLALKGPASLFAVLDMQNAHSEEARALQAQTCKNATYAHNWSTFEKWNMKVSNYLMIAGLGSGLLFKGGTRLAAMGGRAATIGSQLSKTAVVLGKASDAAMWGMAADLYMSERNYSRMRDRFALGSASHSELAGSKAMRDESRKMMLMMPLMWIPGVMAGHGAHSGAHAGQAAHVGNAAQSVIASTAHAGH